jgi:hypothetical protein
MISVKKLLYKMVEVIKENRLPEATTADEGKILGVKTDGEYGLVEHFPEATAADAGKVLGIKSNGSYGLIPQTGGGGSVQLHEQFATIASVPANGNSYVDVPISTLGITDPDTIVMISVEYSIGEYRMNNPASTALVVGYSIRRDMGSNSYIRLLAKNNSSTAYTRPTIRFVYTTIDE